MKKINIAVMVVLAALLVGCAQPSGGGEDDPLPPPPAITYTVTFDVDRGNAIDALVAEEDSLVTLPAATRAGYDFLGWDTNADGTADSASFVLTENVTAKALWSGPLSYTLTLVIDSFVGWNIPTLEEGWSELFDGERVDIDTYGNSITLPVKYCTYTVPYDTVITLPVATNENQSVGHDGWSTVAGNFDGSADYSTTYTMGDADITLYNAYH